MSVLPSVIARSWRRKRATRADSAQAMGVYTDEAALYTRFSTELDFAMTKSRKTTGDMAEPRKNSQACAAEMKEAREIDVISRGKLIARIVVGDPREHARERLLAARKRCRVGDVISPTGAEWAATIW